MTPSGITIGTFRREVQCQNQLRHRVPNIQTSTIASVKVSKNILRPFPIFITGHCTSFKFWYPLAPTHLIPKRVEQRVTLKSHDLHFSVWLIAAYFTDRVRYFLTYYLLLFWTRSSTSCVYKHYVQWIAFRKNFVLPLTITLHTARMNFKQFCIPATDCFSFVSNDLGSNLHLFPWTAFCH